MSTHIHLPGTGLVDLTAEKVNKAVQEYDERLRFGRNELTGDYCIFIKMPLDFAGGVASPEGQLYPVIGFGAEIPEVGYAIHRLRKADALRNGEAILRDINKHNEGILDAGEPAAVEAAGIAAEAIEWFNRTQDKTRYSRVYRPRQNAMGGWS